MKNKYLNIFMVGIAFIYTACNEDPFSYGNEGKIYINASVNSQMTVETRAEESSLRESLKVWISNSDGKVVNKFDSVPKGLITLTSGNYLAEAWAGDSVAASFEKQWFKGFKSFEVKDNETTPVTIICKIANVGATVDYDEKIPEILEEYSMTVGNKGGTLEFTGENATKTGFFMMPSSDKNLSYNFTGTQKDGNPIEITGIIENVKPAVNYVLKVVCNEKSNEVGGAIFTIVIDDQELELQEHELELVAAPQIKGFDFDINSQIVAEKGQVGQKLIYVSSASKIDSLYVDSDLLQDIPEMNGFTDVNLLTMNQTMKDALASKGLTYYEITNNIKEGQSLYQITIDNKFTRDLDNGSYSITFSAVDQNKKKSVATMRLLISDALVNTEPIQDINTIDHHSAVLYGSVVKDGVENVGFRYRAINSGDWKEINATVTRSDLKKGDRFTAKLSNLEDGQTYEYKAYCDDFESSQIHSFTTLECLQLPNSSFENWSTYNNKIYIPGLSYNSTTGSEFWDSGNHGSTTLGEKYNITTQSSNYVHEGTSSACLQSKWIIAKFGAGNIFAGKYLKTDGTDGVIGMGRPFKAKPISVKLWVRYEPKEVLNRKGSGSHLSAGEDDKGQIYIALTDDTMDEYDGVKWPFVVKTKTSEQKLFDQNDARVIAYGEYIFDKATEGAGLVQIEIKLNYKRNITPSNILFTASASQYGDYFEGGDGTTMYLDDIELIYE